MSDIEQVYTLYHPIVARLLVFRTSSDTIPMFKMDSFGCKIIRKADLLVAIVQRNIYSEAKWNNISYTRIDKEFKKIATLAEKVKTEILSYGKGMRCVGAFDFLVCGAEEGYWQCEEVEFRTDTTGVIEGVKGVVTKSKLETLFEAIDSKGGGEVHGNTMTHKLKTELYVLIDSVGIRFGMISVEIKRGLSEEPDVLVEYERCVSRVMEILAAIIGGTAIIKDKCSNIIRKYKSLDTAIKQKAHELRKNVWSILNATEEGSRKYRREREEWALRYAARYLFKTTDMLYEINTKIHDVEKRIEDMELALTSLSELPMEGYGKFKSITITLRYHSNRDLAQLKAIKTGIQNSETSLRNSLELLKTYLESEQRVSAERSTRALGILSLIFAAFGITDTISNFYIYYLEHRSIPTLFEAIVSFGITMIWPVVFLLAAYYFYLKRKW